MDILDFLKQDVAARYIQEFLEVLSEASRLKTLLEHVEFSGPDVPAEELNALRLIALEALEAMLPFEQKLRAWMNVTNESEKLKRVLDPNDLSNN
jgi:F0F1-type ATP synthase delta subunit